MTRRPQALRLCVLAALAILAAAWLLFPHGPGTPDTRPLAAPATADPANPAPTSPAGATAAVDLPPLPPPPPPDARIQDVLPALQARADAGDGIAACRMSIELMRCQILSTRVRDKQALQERLLARPGIRANPEAVAEVEENMAKLRVEAASCDHLPDGLADRAQHYLRAAALAGEPMSRLRYASGEGFNDTDGYAYLLTPGFDQWRREAEGMMQQSLADGRPEAALILAFAYAGDQGLFSGLVADDASQALAHVQLMHRLFGPSIAAFPVPLPQPGVPEADVSRAHALAEDWHLRHFGGRQFDLGELMESHGTPPWVDLPTADTRTDPCPGAEAMTDG